MMSSDVSGAELGRDSRKRRHLAICHLFFVKDRAQRRGVEAFVLIFFHLYRMLGLFLR